MGKIIFEGILIILRKLKIKVKLARINLNFLYLKFCFEKLVFKIEHSELTNTQTKIIIISKNVSNFVKVSLFSPF